MIKLKYDTLVTAASYGRYERHVLPVVEATGLNEFLYVAFDGSYWSPVLIVGAASWTDAYETAIDERPTVAPDDLWMAYGFDSPEEYDAAVMEAKESGHDWPDLAEGYTYQSNASGTGIVDTSEFTIVELTRDLMKKHGIEVSIRHFDRQESMMLRSYCIGRHPLAMLHDPVQAMPRPQRLRAYGRRVARSCVDWQCPSWAATGRKQRGHGASRQ